MQIETSDQIVKQAQELEQAAILSSTWRNSKFGNTEPPPNSFAMSLVSKLLQPPLSFQHIAELGAGYCNTAAAISRQFSNIITVEASDLQCPRLQAAQAIHSKLPIFAEDAVSVAKRLKNTKTIFVAINLFGNLTPTDLQQFLLFASKSASAVICIAGGLNPDDPSDWRRRNKIGFDHNLARLFENAGFALFFGAINPHPRRSGFSAYRCVYLRKDMCQFCIPVSKKGTGTSITSIIPKETQNDAENLNMNLFLISGTMRSGTSLLADLLYSRLNRCARHPEVVCSMEGVPAFRKQVEKLNEIFENRSANECIENKDTVFRQQVEAHSERRFISTIISDLRNVCGKICGHELNLSTRFGVKYTNLWKAYEVLRGHCSECRLILTIRDPRDVFASHKYRKFQSPPLSHFSIIFDMLSLHSYIEKLVARQDVIVLKYENLASAPREEIVRVLEFLGVEVELFDWSALNSDILNNSSFHINKKSGAIGVACGVQSPRPRYLDFLSPLERQFITMIFRDMMMNMGYEPDEDSGLGPFISNVYLPELVNAGLRGGYDLSELHKAAEVNGFSSFLKAALENPKTDTV
jgi:hypothetical protein